MEKPDVATLQSLATDIAQKAKSTPKLTKRGSKHSLTAQDHSLKELTFTTAEISKVIKSDMGSNTGRQWCLAGSKILGQSCVELYETSGKQHGQQSGEQPGVQIDVNEAAVAKTTAEVETLYEVLSDPSQNNEISCEDRLQMILDSFDETIAEATSANLFPGTGRSVKLKSDLRQFQQLEQWVSECDGIFSLSAEALDSVKLLSEANEAWTAVVQLMDASKKGPGSKDPSPSARVSQKRELIDVIDHAQTKAAVQVQRIHSDSWKSAIAFLGQVGVWTLRRQAVADRARSRIRECDLQQVDDFVPASVLVTNYLDKAQQIKTKPDKGFTGSIRAFKAEADKQRSDVLVSLMTEWEKNIVRAHSSWTDTFISDFARSTILDIAAHTDKLMKSIPSMVDAFKGCVIDETEQAKINQLRKEGEFAVDEHRERLQKIINAGAASHQSKLERIREEIAKCAKQLSDTDAYSDKAALLGNKDFKRKMKKIENQLEGSRSDGIQRLIKATIDPIVIKAAISMIRIVIHQAKVVEKCKLDYYRTELVQLRGSFEAKVDKLLSSSAEQLSTGRDNFLLAIASAMCKRLDDIHKERCNIAKQDALLELQQSNEPKSTSSESPTKKTKKKKKKGKTKNVEDTNLTSAADSSFKDSIRQETAMQDTKVSNVEVDGSSQSQKSKSKSSHGNGPDNTNKPISKQLGVKPSIPPSKEIPIVQSLSYAVDHAVQEAQNAVNVQPSVSEISVAGNSPATVGSREIPARDKRSAEQSQKSRRRRKNVGVVNPGKSDNSKVVSNRSVQPRVSTQTNLTNMENVVDSVQGKSNANIGSQMEYQFFGAAVDETPGSESLSNLSRDQLEAMCQTLILRNNQLELKVDGLSNQLKQSQQMLVMTNQVVREQMALQASAIGIDARFQTLASLPVSPAALIPNPAVAIHEPQYVPPTAHTLHRSSENGAATVKTGRIDMPPGLSQVAPKIDLPPGL